MFSAVLYGYMVGRDRGLLATLGSVYEDREDARRAARAEWGSIDSDRRAEGSTIKIVDLTDPEWSYLMPVAV